MNEESAGYISSLTGFERAMWFGEFTDILSLWDFKKV